MKVAISDVIEIRREVELPDHCPSCNEQTDGIVLVQQFEHTTQPVAVSDGEIAELGISEPFGDHLPVGWRCRGCGEELCEPGTELTIGLTTTVDDRATAGRLILSLLYRAIP